MFSYGLSGRIRGGRSRPYHDRNADTEDVVAELKSQPTVQFSKLVGEALKVMLFKVPANVAENGGGVFEASLAEFVEVARFWHELTDDYEEAKEFSDTLDSLVIVWQCGAVEERRRPDASSVRMARRTLLNALQGSSPSSEVAKAMSYEGPKSLMNIAKNHAAVGVGDDAATAKYEAASRTFETKLTNVFDDTESWLEEGNAGWPVDIYFMPPVLRAVEVFVADVLTSMERWSAARLQDRSEDILNDLVNVNNVLMLGNFVLVRSIYEELLRNDFLQVQTAAPVTFTVAPPDTTNAMNSPDNESTQENTAEVRDGATGEEDAAGTYGGSVSKSPLQPLVPSFETDF